MLDGDVTMVGSFAARFSGVVYPGETLRVRIWRTEKGYQAVTTSINRSDEVVLDETMLTVR
jgi:acyl dehydratase